MQQWLQPSGSPDLTPRVGPGEIAVIAPTWDQLNGARLILERAGVPTFALRNGNMKLLRHYATSQMLRDLRAESERIWEPTESVEQWVRERARQWGRSLAEPTMKTLCKIAGDLDRERGFGASDIALPISAEEIITALYEFNESDNAQVIDEESVLVTTRHSAKGLEFRKVIVLADGFSWARNELESERRALYVAMTRAKEELVLTTLHPDNHFVREAGLTPQRVQVPTTTLPQRMYYSDFTPADVNLGHLATRQQQDVIATLQEGCALQLVAREDRYGWIIATETGIPIGALSYKATNELAEKKISPNHFVFQRGEVTLRAIYHHVKMNEVTGEVEQDWFVPIPQIRICR